MPPEFQTFDDGTGPVEVGSIAERTRHTQRNERYWHWGVDIMPLMSHGGRPPSGNAKTFEAALEAFKAAFTAWHAGREPELWEKNRDYIAAGAERWHR